MKILSVAMVCIGINLNTAYAGFQDIGDKEGWLLGLAVEAELSGYKHTDKPMSSIMPYVAYEWENLHVGIDNLKYDFFNDRQLALAASLEPRWSFANTDDSPIFNTIERDDALEAGITAHYKMHSDLVSYWYLQGHLLSDISNVHNGQQLSAILGFNREFATIELDVQIGATYHSQKLSQYLYGVQTQESSADLMTFSPNASTHPFIDMSMMMQIEEASLFVITASYELYDHQIKKSPLLDKAGNASILVGVVKQF